MSDFLPRREADLLAWARGFGKGIESDPESLGLTPQQADSFAALAAEFAELFQLAQGPMTRTPAGIHAKNTALARLKAEARVLAGVVRANPAVSEQQRFDLGLGLPRDGGSTIHPPAGAPILRVTAVDGLTVRLRLRDPESLHRVAKPRGVAGAVLFRYIGDEPPAELEAWSLAGHTTETTAEVYFPVGLRPGEQVWLTAAWLNPRLQAGPLATPTGTRLLGGIGRVASLRAA